MVSVLCKIYMDRLLHPDRDAGGGILRRQYGGGRRCACPSPSDVLVC